MGYDDDDYSDQEPIFDAQTAIMVAAIIAVVWILGSIRASEGYRPCYGDCPSLPAKQPAVINPYVWPYSGASCLEDLYIMDRDVRGGSTAQPLVSLNTPDHTILSSVSFVV